MSTAGKTPENPQVGWIWYPEADPQTPTATMRALTGSVSDTITVALSSLGRALIYSAPPEPSPIRRIAGDGWWNLLYTKQLPDHHTARRLGMPAVRDLCRRSFATMLQYPAFLQYELGIDTPTIEACGNYMQVAPSELPSGELWVPSGLADPQYVGQYENYWNNQMPTDPQNTKS